MHGGHSKFKLAVTPPTSAAADSFYCKQTQICITKGDIRIGEIFFELHRVGLIDPWL
jgi:hypothetical protein